MFTILAQAAAQTSNHESTIVHYIALDFLALMQGLSMYRAGKNHEKSHREIAEVKTATADIKKSVDGPLGIALASAASAMEAVARLTGNPEKILEAVAARRLSDEHNKSQAMSLAASKKSEDEKQAIIEEFLAREREKQKPGNS